MLREFDAQVRMHVGALFALVGWLLSFVAEGLIHAGAWIAGVEMTEEDDA